MLKEAEEAEQGHSSPVKTKVVRYDVIQEDQSTRRTELKVPMTQEMIDDQVSIWPKSTREFFDRKMKAHARLPGVYVTEEFDNQA